MSGIDVGAILKSLGGGGGSGDLMGGLQSLLQGSGGLGGLLSQLQGSGLGDQVESWIGKGDNKPVSAQQVEQAIGKDELSAVAEKAGVSKAEAASGIAEMLPQLVDKLTPDGKLPDIGPLDDVLRGLLAR
jgi:uncharacterized protein YidB (DUF937 family)